MAGIAFSDRRIWAFAIGVIAVTTSLSLLLLWRYGKETRGRDLRDLDPGGHIFDKTGYQRRFARSGRCARAWHG